MRRFVLPLTACLTLAFAGVAAAADTKVPPGLVLDLRLFEARSTRPDYQAMDGLSFFIDTDGSGVTEPQWLATILRKTPDSILATLAYESLPVEGGAARWSLEKRTRSFDVKVEMNEFSDKGTFPATATVSLVRGDEVLKKTSQPIELRLGQTYVFGSRDLEISASDYLSHFRDFEGSSDRGKLYESLRNFTFFLVLAVTPRIPGESSSPTPMVDVTRNDSVSLDKLESPIGVPIEGEVQVEIRLDADGTPTDARILRSSVPELNPRVLGEAPTWRFPEASGKRARLTLALHAEP